MTGRPCLRFGLTFADFQLELLMQALQFSRASAKEGGATKSLATIVLGSMFLRYVWGE
jgi:hypothetical protein